MKKQNTWQNKENKINPLSNNTDNNLMYQEIKITNFRGIKDLEIKKLNRINIFFGPNNCGKTSVLEAVFSTACGYNIDPLIKVLTGTRSGNKFKSYSEFGNKIITLFNDVNQTPYEYSIDLLQHNNMENKFSFKFTPSGNISEFNPITIERFDDILKGNGIFIGNFDIKINDINKSFNINYPTLFIPENPFRIGKYQDIFSYRFGETSLSSIYSNLKKMGLMDSFLIEMKVLIPNIKEIDNISYSDGYSNIYIRTTDNKFLPIDVFGDGIRRWFELFGNMIIYNNSIHCIEEIDTTFHYSAMENMSKNILNYAVKYNNQLFVTTHNIEFADCFLKSIYENNNITNEIDLVSFYTIIPPSELTDNKHIIRHLYGNQAYKKRIENNLELR